MNRRQLLIQIGRLFAGAAALSLAGPSLAAAALKKSKAEWRALLPKESYAVLFEEATERPGSSPLNAEKRTGTYVCAACNQPLFNSAQKFESGTGWPSFFDVLPKAVEKRTDYKMILPRTEYHCARCGGHQGHVFDDGPKPTGLRYCNNGVALRFVAADSKLPELRA
ncbi:MAG: peptide-methionine (R)-S-oxide reductase MsrB [Pseudomonadota bacterium]